METVRMALRRILHEGQHLKVLDVGTGQGDFLNILIDSSEATTEFVGIDIKSEYLQKAKIKFTDDLISFEVMSADKMSFKDGSFDVVCISNTLHHLPDPHQVLAEMKRVLKPAGFLIINEMVSDQQSKKQQSHVSMHHFSAELDTLLGGVHNRTYDRSELAALVLSNDLELTESLEYVISPEEPEHQLIDKFYHAMSKRILELNNRKSQEDFQDELERRIELIKTVGFELATEVLMIVRRL